jgi:hypothetical protein
VAELLEKKYFSSRHRQMVESLISCYYENIGHKPQNWTFDFSSNVTYSYYCPFYSTQPLNQFLFNEACTSKVFESIFQVSGELSEKEPNPKRAFRE